MTALALTAAGRAAVADADHVGTDAIEITHLAVGDGLRPAGADDDGRTALRSERERQPVAGRQAADGHVALVADWTPAASYAATEIGLVADVDGDTVLLAYWAAEAAAGAAVRAAAGTRLLIAVDVAVTSSAADLAVTLSPSVTFATPPPAATTAVAGISRRATGAEVAAAAAADDEADRAALERAAHLTPYEAARIAIAMRGELPTAATTAAAGISRRATGAEVDAAAAADEEADRAPLERAAHVTPYEMARLAIAMRGNGALPRGRGTLLELANALAALERKVEEGMDRIAVYWGAATLYEAGGNIAGAAVSAVQGGSGVSLPAGTYHWHVLAGRDPRSLFDGATEWPMAEDHDAAGHATYRAVVSAAAARVWSLGPASAGLTAPRAFSAVGGVRQRPHPNASAIDGQLAVARGYVVTIRRLGA